MQQMLERLLDTMREITKHDVCVAFSGGVDSSLLLRTASTVSYTHLDVYKRQV